MPFCYGIVDGRVQIQKPLGSQGGVNVPTVFIKKHTVEPR